MAGRFHRVSDLEDRDRRDPRPRTGRRCELHWHPTADEWQYVIDGNISVTMFGSHGRYRTETLDKGDVGYIPQGYGHSIENVGEQACRVLIGFNTGIYETIDLSQWIAGNPADVLATNFGNPRPCSRSSRTKTSSSPARMAPANRARPWTSSKASSDRFHR